MKQNIRIFAFSTFATLLGIVVAYFYGGLTATFTVIVLIVIEAAFSFDNAVLNARILRQMSPFWQRIFLTIGILIAVFGMRLVFPIVIVMLAASLKWQEVLRMAVFEPDNYSAHLHDAHTSIAVFGGMFLLMLAIYFFTDSNREVRWLKFIEKILQRLDSLTWRIVLAALPLATLALALPGQASSILKIGLAGVVTYVIIHNLTELMLKRQHLEATQKTALAAGSAGFMAFLYLEVLDASLSFDGVIGAFAITKDVILIAIGLGVGAFWVRSLTVYLVRKDTLKTLIYIEHGAFYVVILLALFLLLSVIMPISEFIIGLIGILVIGAAVVSSRRAALNA